jgi:Flp pilus assembly protein TadD
MPLHLLSHRAFCEHRADRVRTRSIVLATCFAAWAVLGSGCLVTPRQPQGSAPAPQLPEGAVAAEAAARLQAPAQKTEFHAKATDRQSFQVHIDFGRIFESQGNFDAALQEYQEALAVVETKRHGSLGPADSALAQRRMAGALDCLGRFAQADVHYQKALSLAPKNPKIWNDIGYSYYLQGRWSDAERALKTAAKLAPDDERIRINLGLTLAAAGKTSEAIPLLSRSTGDATGHANLGYLLAATGQFDLARRQYQMALGLRPDMELARRAIARLDRQQQDPGLPGATNELLAGKARATPPPADQQVTRAAAIISSIPPPRNWSFPPGARAPGALVGAARSQTGSPEFVDVTKLPPPPPL